MFLSPMILLPFKLINLTPLKMNANNPSVIPHTPRRNLSTPRKYLYDDVFMMGAILKPKSLNRFALDPYSRFILLLLPCSTPSFKSERFTEIKYTSK